MPRSPFLDLYLVFTCLIMNLETTQRDNVVSSELISLMLSYLIVITDRTCCTCWTCHEFRFSPDSTVIQQEFSSIVTCCVVIVELILTIFIGTCNNNQTDDCMLPSGKIDLSCPNMAHEWLVNRDNCEHPIHPTSGPLPNPCKTTTCEIMKSRYCISNITSHY